MWILFAFLSAFFAGVTSILAKFGIKKTDSNVATAIRTIIVLLFSWIMVFVVGSQSAMTVIEAKTLVFLVLSGLATGASWLCYFKALQLGDINKVVPIDKSSTVLTFILAAIFFSEFTWLGAAGITLIAIGTSLMIEKKDVVQTDKKSKSWFLYAVGSAVFASLTAILGKIGISGVESNRCCACYGLDHGFCNRQTERNTSYGEKRAWVYFPVGTCHRRIMALLLQSIAGWTCKCCCANRQTQHSCDDCVLFLCVQGETDKEINNRTSSDCDRYTDNDSINTIISGKVSALMVRLAVPTVIAQLVKMLYNIVDRIYIGHIEGIRKIALSGVGLCFPIILLIFAFTSLTGAEGAPLAYIEMGKGDSPLNRRANILSRKT